MESVMDWMVSLKNSYVETWTVFEERAYKEVIKVKWGHEGGALIQQDLCCYKKRRYKECACTDERAVRTEQQGGHLQAR